MKDLTQKLSAKQVAVIEALERGERAKSFIAVWPIIVFGEWDFSPKATGKTDYQAQTTRNGM